MRRTVRVLGITLVTMRIAAKVLAITLVVTGGFIASASIAWALPTIWALLRRNEYRAIVNVLVGFPIAVYVCVGLLLMGLGTIVMQSAAIEEKLGKLLADRRSED